VRGAEEEEKKEEVRRRRCRGYFPSLPRIKIISSGEAVRKGVAPEGPTIARGASGRQNRQKIPSPFFSGI